MKLQLTRAAAADRNSRMEPDHSFNAKLFKQAKAPNLHWQGFDTSLSMKNDSFLIDPYQNDSHNFQKVYGNASMKVPVSLTSNMSKGVVLPRKEQGIRPMTSKTQISRNAVKTVQNITAPAMASEGLAVRTPKVADAPSEQPTIVVPDITGPIVRELYWDTLLKSREPKHSEKQKEAPTSIVKVVFIRHGQSTANSDGVFSGWLDVPLSDKGRDECRQAGRFLKEQGIKFDRVYTSMLDRAIETTRLVMEEMGDDTEVIKDWRLNERHYGQLQGKDKRQMVQEFGREQVDLWRQSYNDPPPFITYDDAEHPRFDKLYKEIPDEEYEQMPCGESLEMVKERISTFWNDEIFPKLNDVEPGKTILFSAHKHVLRGLVQHLAELTPDQVPKLIIPNASPFIFEFDKDNDLKMVRNYYLDDESKEVFENAKEDDAHLS